MLMFKQTLVGSTLHYLFCFHLYLNTIITKRTYEHTRTSFKYEKNMAGKRTSIINWINQSENFKIKQIPETVHYVPDFITESEERLLIKEVYSAPKPKWTQLAHRRLQNWGGLPHPKGMLAEPLPQWLQTYVKRVADLGIFGDKTPNHVLVNEYLPGQGIMPHTDGPLFLPVVTTINLGSTAVLDFYTPIHEPSTQDIQVQEKSLEDRHVASLLLEPRSLLVVQHDMYHNHLHGIKEVNQDTVTDSIANLESCKAPRGILPRSTRISLTIRHVPKTLRGIFNNLR